jgi:hypothetical protein
MSDLNSGAFSEQRKNLLRLIDELRDTDVKNELDLPRIVVVGVRSRLDALQQI